MPTPIDPSSRGPRRKVVSAIAAAVVMLATTVFSVGAASSAGALSSFDQELLGYINDHRVSKGLAPFFEHAAFSDAARGWSTTMRDQSPAPCGSPGSAFRHDSMTRIMSDGVPPGTTGAGENIAWTCGPRGRLFGTNWSYSAMPAHCRASLDYTSALLQFCQWINSSGHRQAIENSSYRWIGVGSSEKSASGQTSVFSTTRFSNAPAPTPEPTPEPTPTASNLTCRNEPVTVDLSLGQEPTEGDDVIVGTSSADVIDGKGGNDLICGLGGGDTIYGGPGNDRIYSQRGRDIVYGGSGDDVIFGGGRDDEIHGGTGNDLMFGGGGSDTMYGGDGIDVVKGNKDSDRLFGDGGDDTLRGNAGDDTLDGGPDDDVLRGGLGSDACDGTDGADKTVSCETLTRLP